LGDPYSFFRIGIIVDDMLAVEMGKKATHFVLSLTAGENGLEHIFWEGLDISVRNKTLKESKQLSGEV
jgi:hypothetical protein